jgi:hypothetical protein
LPFFSKSNILRQYALIARMNLIQRSSLLLLLAAGLAPTTLPAQLFLALTPEAYLYHDSMPRPGRYQISGTTAFVDALVEAHLDSKLTLYRDFERSLPYPSKGAFVQYLKELRHPEWDESLNQLAQTPGVADSLAVMRQRQASCDDCLALASRWLLEAGGDSITLRNQVKGPEEQLSLYKQIGKARDGFRQMANLDLSQPQRYLLFTARLDQTKDQASLTWQQGILLASYHPYGDQRQPAKLRALFFDPNDLDIPWFLLRTHAMMAGIREENGAQALLTEFRTDMTPLGFRVITEEATGPWRSLNTYVSGDGRRVDSLQKDSARRSWHLERALMSPQQLATFYPRQSKSVSLWLDGRWTPDNLYQQGLNPWAFDEQEDTDWAKTHAMITGVTPKLLAALDTGTLALYEPSQSDQDLRRRVEQSFPDMLAQRETYARTLLPDSALTPTLAHVRTRSAEETTVPDSNAAVFSLPTSWQNLEKQTYSWQLRGEMIWLQGLHTFMPLWLDVYWHPPVDSATPYPMLSIAWSDLEKQDYRLDETPLTEVLIAREYGYYPTQVNETRLGSIDHATMVRLILQEGAWDAFPEWLIQQVAPPGATKEVEDAWKDAWKEVRRNMRNTVY